MKKKHQFHCQACHSALDIYKKGKHRLIVCPGCGILASNPIPLLAAAAPLAISAVSSLFKKKEKKDDTADAKKIIFDSLDKPNRGERYVYKALG